MARRGAARIGAAGRGRARLGEARRGKTNGTPARSATMTRKNMKEYRTADDVLADVPKDVMLSFSCGKDSIACWLVMRGKKNIFP